MTDQLKLFDPNAPLKTDPEQVANAGTDSEAPTSLTDDLHVAEAGDTTPPDLPPAANGAAGDIPSPAAILNTR